MGNNVIELVIVKIQEPLHWNLIGTCLKFVADFVGKGSYGLFDNEICWFDIRFVDDLHFSVMLSSETLDTN